MKLRHAYNHVCRRLFDSLCSRFYKCAFGRFCGHLCNRFCARLRISQCFQHTALRIAAVLLVFIASVSLSTHGIHAVWGAQAQRPADNTNSGGVVIIGYWYKQDIDNPQGAPVVEFDATNPPQTTIAAGSVVIYKDPTGKVVIFKALKDIPPNNSNFDPSKPNTSWAKPMLYSENTREYREFHHYDKGDYVLYKGKTYKYVWGIRHNPNTITQKSPEHAERWELVSNSELRDLWYSHVIYLRNTIVEYKGARYKCLLGGYSGFRPDEPSTGVWKKL